MSSKDLFLDQRAMENEEHQAIEHGAPLPKMDSVEAITLANEVMVLINSDYDLPNGFRVRAKDLAYKILSLK